MFCWFLLQPSSESTAAPTWPSIEFLMVSKRLWEVLLVPIQTCLLKVGFHRISRTTNSSDRHSVLRAQAMVTTSSLPLFCLSYLSLITLRHAPCRLPYPHCCETSTPTLTLRSALDHVSYWGICLTHGQLRCCLLNFLGTWLLERESLGCTYGSMYVRFGACGFVTTNSSALRALRDAAFTENIWPMPEMCAYLVIARCEIVR